MIGTSKRDLQRLSRSLAAIAGIFLFALSLAAQGKRPVIIIPGLTGSELINSQTGEKVWFKARRSKVDDLRLPISPNLNANRDSLIPGDIIRSIKTGFFGKTDVYQGLIEALENRGGYSEASWSNPKKDVESSLYVYPYDWRLDNVTNARLLVRRVEELKRKLNRPNLKFDVIGHSMGGIIARYAAMYGNADLPSDNSVPVPTWAGAKHFEKIIVLGTPNEGSALSLVNILDGYDIAGVKVNLPFLQNISKFDVFTIPSGYELLPAAGTLRVFDEDLKPINLDLFDPLTWSEYGWNVIDDKDFAKNFSESERSVAQAYFVTVLNRARLFQMALDAPVKTRIPVSINVVGSECKDTVDALIVLRGNKGEKWRVLSKAEEFTRSDGTKVPAEAVKKVLFAPGDGVVTKRSLTAVTLSASDGVESILFPGTTAFVCEGHNTLPRNIEIQDKIIAILSARKP